MDGSYICTRLDLNVSSSPWIIHPGNLSPSGIQILVGASVNKMVPQSYLFSKIKGLMEIDVWEAAKKKHKSAVALGIFRIKVFASPLQCYRVAQSAQGFWKVFKRKSLGSLG